MAAPTGGAGARAHLEHTFPVVGNLTPQQEPPLIPLRGMAMRRLALSAVPDGAAAIALPAVNPQPQGGAAAAAAQAVLRTLPTAFPRAVAVATSE